MVCTVLGWATASNRMNLKLFKKTIDYRSPKRHEIFRSRYNVKTCVHFYHGFLQILRSPLFLQSTHIGRPSSTGLSASVILHPRKIKSQKILDTNFENQ